MAKAKVVVTATDNLAKGLNQSKRQLSDFEKYIKGVGKKLDKAFNIASVTALAVAGFKAMSKAARQCIEEYAEAERVTKRLEAVWANVGDATGKSSKQINDYAESIEKVTYFSAESVKESALLLAATESLTEDGFQRALDVSVDLAAALGEDVTSAAQTLAKAIQEPEAALSRLKTIGVSFTDDEKAQIKALADANKQYEAQSLILDKIEDKYKGVAKAINNTPAGTLDNIKDTLSDIRKNLGGALLDTITPALNTLYNALVRISNWIAENSDSTVSKIKNDIYTAAKSGGIADLSQYTTQQLLKAVESANYDALHTSDPSSWLSSTFGPGVGSIADYINKNVMVQVNRELRDRGYNSFADAQKGNLTINPTVTGSVATAVEEGVSTLEDFLSSYGKESIDYQRKAYEKIIADAQKYQAELLSERSGLLRQGIYDISTGKLVNQDRIDEISATLAILGQIVGGYNNKITSLYPTTAGPDVLNPLARFDSSMGGMFSYSGDKDSSRGMAFNDALTGSLTSSLGQFGSVVAEATSNLTQMGPVLGSLMTVLKPIIQGIGTVLGPMLDAITTSVLEPLLEVGKAVGALLLPVLTLLTPVLEALGEGIIIVSSVFQWVGQLLQHWAASFVNAFSWLTGYSMRDPGSPGNILDYITGKVEAYRSNVGSATYGSSDVATQTAISSAGYQGATSVTINIYPQGPIVGDGGMREFARMIRDEFDALSYYGVGA